MPVRRLFLLLSLSIAAFVAILSSGRALPTAANTGDGRFHADQISAGFAHNCALLSDLTAECWGNDPLGVLGNTTISGNKAAPIQVCAGAPLGHACSPLTDIAQIVAGPSSSGHTCALMTSASAKCWGSNAWGQLGDGTTTASTAPVDVSGISDPVTAVAVGEYHTCALTEEASPGAGGAVYCWGNNADGQLGIGSSDTSTHPTPALVSGLSSGITAIAAGSFYTCALTTTNTAKCWGDNAVGQLGDGTTIASNVPADVCATYSSGPGCDTVLDNITAIQDSGYLAFLAHTCALRSTGSVSCWGSNLHGQLGIGSTDNSPHPLPAMVGGLGDVTVTSIGTGIFHSCAVTSITGLRCWGDNIYGQLGDGTLTLRTTAVNACLDPACLAPMSGAVSVVGGYEQSCALLTTDEVQCWGGNEHGEIGDGTVCCMMSGELTRPTPVYVLLDSDRDGCTDNAENSVGAHTSGGDRNPKNYWDYMNPSGDGLNRIDDILAVVHKFFVDAYLDPPANTVPNPAYNENTDRKLAAGGQPWESAAPDGYERVDDIIVVVHQYFNDCGGPH